MPFRVVLFLPAAVAASPAAAQGNANAAVCAADDDSAFSPEQRIAACTALIKAARNAPKEVADALVNRGQAAWYADKMKQAFADLDRAIALERSAARSLGREGLRQPRRRVRRQGPIRSRNPGLRRSVAARSETKPGVQGSRGRLRTTNARSRTMTRRLSSIPVATAATPIAARPTGSPAETGRRSPMRARRSGSNRLSLPILTIAACPTRRATSTAPS
jgi:hypothetical protein